VKSAGYDEHLDELFAPVGGVSIRRMFGGLGVFKDGLMFGLIDDDILYLKADDMTRPGFEAESSKPWVYQGRHRANVSTSYWRVPERLLDESEEFAEWARAAFGAAVRMKGAKPARKAKAGPTKKTIPKKARVAKKSAPKSAAKPPVKKKAAPKRRDPRMPV
jgi:DNA transformation protein